MDAIVMKGRTILITGAGGFTGRHACEYFTRMGMKVTACVRNFDAAPGNVNTVECDMMSKHRIYEIITKLRPDYVLHLAGKNSVSESWERPIEYMETNIMAAFYLLDALRDIPHCRMLIVGSKLKFNYRETDHAPHPYSLSKTLQQLAATSWMHLFRQDVMLAEPCNLIGPGPSTGIIALIARKMVCVERGKDHEPFHLSSLEEQRDFLDVRDAVRAYEAILKAGRPGLIYPIESGQLRCLGEIMDTFQEYALKPIPVQITGKVVPGSNVTQQRDVSFMRELGWEPEIPFEVSVHDIVEYFRSKQDL